MSTMATKEQLKALVRQAMISVLEEDVYSDRGTAEDELPFASGWFSFIGPDAASRPGKVTHSGIRRRGRWS